MALKSADGNLNPVLWLPGCVILRELFLSSTWCLALCSSSKIISKMNVFYLGTTMSLGMQTLVNISTSLEEFQGNGLQVTNLTVLLGSCGLQVSVALRRLPRWHWLERTHFAMQKT